MIPVLGVPAISPGRIDSMFKSVDCHVADLVFVDNSPDGLPTPSLPNAQVDRVWHLRMPSNLGVATSWNLIVKSTPFAPWWLIAPTDLVWHPGALERIAAEVPEKGVLTGGGPIDWAWFALTETTVLELAEAEGSDGLFDEFFHPIYCEDIDFQMRVKRIGHPIVKPSQDVATHWNSTTIHRDGYAAHNRRTYQHNHSYFQQKWSGFEVPSPSRGWSLSRRREQSWDAPR